MYLESRGLVKSGCNKNSEWTCEGSLKSLERVGAYGEPIRYHEGVYDCIHVEWAFYVNLGGTAEVTKLLSLYEGMKAFFVLQKGGMNVMAKGRFGIHGGQYIPETLRSYRIYSTTMLDGHHDFIMQKK